MTMLAVACSFAFVAACSPEVGSKEWCDNMKEMPADQWTGEAASDFTKYCAF